MVAAYTTPSDVFQSQVFADWVIGYAYNNNALLGKTPYCYERNDIDWSDGGATVTVVKFNGKTAAVTLPTDGTAPASQKVTMGSDTWTVAGKYIGLQIPSSTIEDATKKGNFNLFQAIAQQVAEAMGDAIDKDLITEAETTTLSHACTTGGITYDDIIDARGKWGDKMSRDSALVLHSAPYIQALKLSEVRSASGFGAPTLQTGALPAFGGVPITVSDNITTAVSGQTTTYTNLLLRARGLGISFRRQLKYKLVPVAGDQDLHEFTMRYVCMLDNNRLLPGAIKLTSSITVAA